VAATRLRRAVSISAALALFTGGLVVTVTSSLVLARELDRIGERLGFSEALLGLVTALGADGPEISSAVAAIVSGHKDTGVGVVVGSNVFNIAALLGLSAVIAGHVRIHRHGLVLNGGVAILIAVVGALLAVRWLPPWAALVLVLVVAVPYVALSSLHARSLDRLPAPLREAVWEEQRDARRDAYAGPGGFYDVLVVAPALTGVIGGATAMVYAAQSLGDRWDVSDVIVGTLVLAALTGIPNVLAAIRLAVHGRGAACVSESFNSNNANIVVGLCIPALVLGISAPSGLARLSAAAMVGMTVLACALGYSGGGLTRREGALIIALYVAFAVVVASY
jgi:cation:H+ antiporter